MGNMGTNQMEQTSTVFVIEPLNTGHERAAAVFQTRGYQVRSFDSHMTFLDEADPDQPGCVIADDRSGAAEGLALLDALGQHGYRLPAIIVTDSDDLDLAVAAMKRGAADVVKRPFSAETLVSKVEKALDGLRQTRASEIAASTIKRRMTRLTPRELEVMDLVATGLPNKSIARCLGIGHRTVEVHRAHLMEKLQAASSAELIMMVFVTRGLSTTLQTWAAAEYGVGWRYSLELSDTPLVPAE